VVGAHLPTHLLAILLGGPVQQLVPVATLERSHRSHPEMVPDRADRVHRLLDYSLSYTHKLKSRTEHVWPGQVKALRKEVEEYKRLKKLTAALIDLSIELSHWGAKRVEAL